MMTEIKFLYRILSIIEPYLQDLILVGGFASLLYSVHEEAENDDNPPLITYDVDLASEGKVAIKGEKSIHEAVEIRKKLIKEHGNLRNQYRNLLERTEKAIKGIQELIGAGQL